MAERECDLTQTLAILGTPFYMAPEQSANAHAITAAADIYSLGAILFHLLTGQPPFRGENAMEVLRNAAERPSPRLTDVEPQNSGGPRNDLPEMSREKTGCALFLRRPRWRMISIGFSRDAPFSRAAPTRSHMPCAGCGAIHRLLALARPRSSCLSRCFSFCDRRRRRRRRKRATRKNQSRFCLSRT